jgi:hypothetical protein
VNRAIKQAGDRNRRGVRRRPEHRRAFAGGGVARRRPRHPVAITVRQRQLGRAYLRCERWTGMGGSDVPDRARSRGAPISSSTPPASPRGASRGRCPPGPQVSYQLKMSEELFWRRRPSWGHRIAEGLAVLTKSALARLRHKSSLTPPHRVIEYLRTTTHRRSFQSIPLGPLGRRHVVARSARRGEGASKFYNRHARGKARPPPEDGTDARAFNAATTTARSSTLSSSDGLRKSGGHLARCAPPGGVRITWL